MIINKTIYVFLQIQGGHHYVFLYTLKRPHVNRRRTFQLSNVRMCHPYGRMWHLYDFGISM